MITLAYKDSTNDIAFTIVMNNGGVVFIAIQHIKVFFGKNNNKNRAHFGDQIISASILTKNKGPVAT